jgi:hypothetical protein
MRGKANHSGRETSFGQLAEASRPYVAAFLIMFALLSVWAGLCAV